MKYNFDEVINREGTNAIKTNLDFIKKYLGVEPSEDVIHLWVADMDFRCSQPIVDALHKRVDALIYGYTSIATDKSYFKSITDYFEKNYDYKIDPEHIVYSPGTVSALDHLVKVGTNVGDGVLIQRPVYGPFTQAVVGNKRELVINELKNNNGYYEIDFEDFEEKAKRESTKMFILCHPHNPTGRIWTMDELNKMVDICLDHDVLIVADEIHADIRRAGQSFTPIGTLSDDERIVTCTAINKAYNTAGLHCSNIVIRNKDMRFAFKKSMGFPSASPFAVEAIKAAYNESEEWLEQVNAYIDENFNFARTFFNTHLPKVTFKEAEGTYLAWFDFSAYGLTKGELQDLFVNEARVIVEAGEMFGDEGVGFIRINLASSRTVLLEAFKRIASAFKDK